MSILTNPGFWTGLAGAIGAVTALVVALRARGQATATSNIMHDHLEYHRPKQPFTYGYQTVYEHPDNPNPNPFP